MDKELQNIIFRVECNYIICKTMDINSDMVDYLIAVAD